MRRKMGARPGLTLAETVVSVTLLSIILIAVATLFPSSLSTLNFTERRNKADLLAYDALDVMASRPFGSLRVGETQPLDGIEIPNNYSLVVRVEAEDGVPVEHLKKVTATVTWSHRAREKITTQVLYVQPAK